MDCALALCATAGSLVVPEQCCSHQDCTMLVLSRKVGEKILIGDNIAVTVVRVAQGVVRLGVEAPWDMPIVREEIKDQLAEDPQDRAPAARP